MDSAAAEKKETPITREEEELDLVEDSPEAQETTSITRTIGSVTAPVNSTTVKADPTEVEEDMVTEAIMVTATDTILGEAEAAVDIHPETGG